VTILRQRGFSLLEILVAFSILALSLGVMMQIFSGSLRNVEVTADLGRAVTLAQSLLASAGAEGEWAPGETSGQHDERFRWRLSSTRYEPDEGSIDHSGTAKPGALELWEVVAEVSWGNESPHEAPRSFTLSSLRLGMPAK
jgi:general secretion pathway protein I